MKMFVKDGRVPFILRGKNSSYPAHYHYEFELLYLTDGDAEVVIGEKSYKLSVGQIFIAFPFVEHEYICRTDGSAIIGIFSPTELPDYCDFMFCSRPVLPIVDQSELYPGFGEAFERFAGYYNSDRADTITARNMLSALVGELMRAMRFEPRGKYQPDAIEKTIAYCRAHYLEPDLSREMTADALGYNRSYLSHIMCDCLGIGFTKFINTLRVDKARKLLAQTDLPITSVAFDCGFQSQRSFNRVFLEFTDMTPSEFRKVWHGRTLYDFYRYNAGDCSSG